MANSHRHKTLCFVHIQAIYEDLKASFQEPLEIGHCIEHIRFQVEQQRATRKLYLYQLTEAQLTTMVLITPPKLHRCT